MDKWLEKKEFDRVFKSFNDNGTQVWVISRVKKLPQEILKMAVRLAELDFINYVRICDETISASSENYAKRPKVPVTKMNHESATGIHIIYCIEYKTIKFL